MFTFTEKDKEQIQAAVQDLEKETSVEVVPYFVEKSGEYASAIYKIPLFTFVSTSIVFIILQMNWMLPKEFTVTVVLSIILMLSTASLLILFFVPSIRIALVTSSQKESICKKRAEIAFLEEEVFNTKSRVGVLIFVSYLEKEVIVLGDKGINEKFEPSDWQKMVDDLVLGVKKGSVVEGLISAINDCKQLVLEKNFIIEKDDKNELKDDLRIGY